MTRLSGETGPRDSAGEKSAQIDLSERGSQPLVLIAQVDALPSRIDEVAALFADYRARVRAEQGNVAFAIYRSEHVPASFLIYEEYRDRIAFREHLDTSHNARFNEALSPLVVGGNSRLALLTPLEVESR